MHIYLVRHGESISNVNKEIHKTTADHAIPLSNEGKRQAVEAAKFLSTQDVDFARIWTSPYKRTRQTAHLIAAKSGMIFDGIREHALLCEQQFGLFDGIPSAELPKLYPQEHAYYKKCEAFEGRFWARMPLGESRFDVAVRVHQAFGTFHRDHDKHDIDKIIVVCHGVTLRAFVMMWCHLTPEWFDKEPNPKNCAIRLIKDGTDRGYIYEGK